MSADRSETEPTLSTAPPPPLPNTRDGLFFAAGCVVFVAGAILRFASPVHLWFDEALTVNIARLPLADLPDALRHDGAPPLFYAMLHVWLRLFGDGDTASRALSGLLGVAMIPLAYVCGRMLAVRNHVDAERGGIGAALIVAVSPFAIRYSTEVRMYALAMVFVLLGYFAVWRALETPTPRRLALVAVVTAALLYTYYWCAFLVAVVLAVLVVQWRFGPVGNRHHTGRVLAATVGGCVLFAPWVPTLLWQLRHTGTPWGGRPTSPVVVATTLTQFAGGSRIDGRILTIVLASLAAIGFWGRRLGRSERTGRTGGARWECVIGVATLAVGLVIAVVTDSAYQVRYAAVVFPFFALAAAHGAALITRNARMIVLALVVGLGFSTSVHAITTPRTQAGEVAAALRSGARTRDVVVYCPDQIAPDTSRLLPDSLQLRQFTFPGFAAPDRVDWTDYAARNHAADPNSFATELIARAGPADIWLVSSPGYLTYDDKCERLEAALAQRRGSPHIIVRSNADFEHMALVKFDD